MLLPINAGQSAIQHPEPIRMWYGQMRHEIHQLRPCIVTDDDVNVLQERDERLRQPSADGIGVVAVCYEEVVHDAIVVVGCLWGKDGDDLVVQGGAEVWVERGRA